MEWVQLLIVIVTLGGLFLWNRSEANSDRRMFHEVLIGMQNEMKDFNHKYMEEKIDFNTKYMQETKEFHGRLVSLEERSKKT